MDVPLTGMYLRTSHKSASYMGVMTALRGKGIDYVKYLTTFEKSTRIIMTDGGRLGLAPSVSKPGDVVAIIKGHEHHLSFDRTSVALCIRSSARSTPAV